MFLMLTSKNSMHVLEGTKQLGFDGLFPHVSEDILWTVQAVGKKKVFRQRWTVLTQSDLCLQDSFLHGRVHTHTHDTVLRLFMGWDGKQTAWRMSELQRKTHLPLLCTSEQITSGHRPLSAARSGCHLCLSWSSATRLFCVLWQSISDTVKPSNSPNLLSACWDLCPQLADSCFQCTGFRDPAKHGVIMKTWVPSTGDSSP